MSLPAGGRAFSLPDATAPAFDMHDLGLVTAAKIPGLNLIVETGQEYAEEEVVAVIVTEAGHPLPMAVCSFYRQHGVIRFEWFSPRQHTHVATVEEALCMVQALAVTGSSRTSTGQHWPVSRMR